MNALEKHCAKLLGKEAAVFVPRFVVHAAFRLRCARHA